MIELILATIGNEDLFVSAAAVGLVRALYPLAHVCSPKATSKDKHNRAFAYCFYVYLHIMMQYCVAQV